MVEAINNESSIPMVGFSEQEEKKDPITSLFKKCVTTSPCDSSSTTSTLEHFLKRFYNSTEKRTVVFYSKYLSSGSTYDSSSTSTYDSSSTSTYDSSSTSTYDSSSSSIYDFTNTYDSGFDTPMIERCLSNRRSIGTIAPKVIAKLKELGLTQYEKTLGEGFFGVVLKLSGESKKNVALKLEKTLIPIANKDKELFGDALGLKLPSNQHLGVATGLLTYHESEVHYIENYDPEIHSEHLLVGVFSKAIDGASLRNRVQVAPLDSEAVKGYGKQLAEALHTLHSNGYIHNDLHMENILVKNTKEEKDPYQLTLLDFGLARKVTHKKVQDEWASFAHLLSSSPHYCDINSQQSLKQNPKFNDLLYNPVKGILAGRRPYSGNEIVNHPFFV